MTQTTLLSARIAALEAEAAPFDALVAEYRALEARLDALDDKIEAARRARHLLSLIEVQVAVALEGDSVTVEITGGAAPISAPIAEPEPREMSQEARAESEEPAASEAPAIPDPPTEAEDVTAYSEPISEPALEEPAQADPADDEENQEPVSDRDRIVAWMRTLDGNEFAAADAADELQLTKSSSETHMRDLLRGGQVVRVDGTGRPNVPSRFREAGRQPAPTPNGETEAETDPEPALPPINPSPWNDTKLSASARIRLLLIERPNLQASTMADVLGIDEQTIRTALHRLMGNHIVKHDDSHPRRYSLTAEAPMVAPAPVAEVPRLSPIPDGLTLDERGAFDCLRHEPAGLSDRVLAARLNWTPQSRVNSVLASLSRKGHVGRNGDRFVVIPEELAGAAP